MWRLYDENISLDQLVEPGGIICVGAKWVGEPDLLFDADWTCGHKTMLKRVHSEISKCDAILTYNGDNFDIPKLNGEFVLHGLGPIPPITSIDLYKSVKSTLKYDSGKLAFISPHLGVGEKIKHEGFKLWTGVMDGDKTCQKRMEEYCLQDVKLLEQLYGRLKPYIKNHPKMVDTAGYECGACGGKRVIGQGFRRTKSFKIQRLQCKECGSWFDGARIKC